MKLNKAFARLHNALLGRGRGIFSNRGSKFFVGFTIQYPFLTRTQCTIAFGSVLCIVALATLTLEFNAMRKHFFPTSAN